MDFEKKTDWRGIRDKQEALLSRYACKSIDSKGRKIAEAPCKIRTKFERDGNRILYAPEFARLRHKAQVFFNVKNDHVCTRMEHVLRVSAIATTIAKTLNLNQDLTHAIALGHDLGHAPFGHSGERVLNVCAQERDPDFPKFRHELNGLRVVDVLARKKSVDEATEMQGLNLTFEVRDGIVSHCGEAQEYILYPDRKKGFADLDNLRVLPKQPYTLEACIVKLVDKIAYVGRDVEDAIRLGIIDMNDISKEIKDVLGYTNGMIVNTLVEDVVENSFDADYIRLSDEKGQALTALIAQNNTLIYRSDKIIRYEKGVRNVIEGVFDNFVNAANDVERLAQSDLKCHKGFAQFILAKGFGDASPLQNTVDFISGMTDNYAMGCYDEIYAL